MAVRLSPQLYQSETAQFLAMFDGQVDGRPPEEKVHDIFKAQLKRLRDHEPPSENEKKFGFLHPVIIAEALAKGMGFSPEETGKLNEIIERTYPIDPTTEFYTKQTLPVTVGLAHLFAGDKETPPVAFIEGDFTNMGGCNKHFNGNGSDGRAETDKLVHQISKLVKNNFKNHSLEVHAVRAGGDETALVVYGLPQAEVDKILKDEVHPEINLLSAQYGVHTIPHTKEEKPPGFGASFAGVDLKQMHDSAEIREKLDKNIKQQKVADAALRSGIVDDEGLVSYLFKYMVPELKERGLTDQQAAAYLEKEKPALKKLAQDTKEEWDKLTGKNGLYRILAEQKNLKAETPDRFFANYAAAHQPGRKADFDAIAIPPLSTSDQVIPFYAVDATRQELEDPEITRLRKALKAFHFDDAADSKNLALVRNTETRRLELPEELTKNVPEHRRRLQKLVVDLMEAFHAPDPSTHTKSASLMVEDAKDYIAQNGGIKVLHFEVTNLSGLNNLTPHLGDAVLRETGKYIRQALAQYPDSKHKEAPEHMADYVYYEGNGKFKAFVPKNYPFSASVEKKLADLVQRNILDERIPLFADRTYTRPFTPPDEPKGDNLQESAAYDRKMEIFNERWQQTHSLHEALEKRIEALGIEPDATMLDIRHPKKDNPAQVGVMVYSNGTIAEVESAPDGLARISAAAESALSRAGQRR